MALARIVSGCLLSICALAILHAAPQAGQAGTVIELDSVRSAGEFRVKLMWLLTVRGEFGRVHGTVREDRFRDQLRVSASIDVDTVHMGRSSYEDWVKSPEFFDAARHPRIQFESAAIPRARLRNGGELRGDLEVRGVRGPVRFELLPATCTKPGFECAIHVHGTIRRSEFGMGSHRGTLSDKVDLDFSIFALSALDPSAAPADTR